MSFQIYKPLDFDKAEDRTYLIDALIEESTDDRRRRYLEDLAVWIDDHHGESTNLEAHINKLEDELYDVENERDELQEQVDELQAKLDEVENE